MIALIKQNKHNNTTRVYTYRGPLLRDVHTGWRLIIPLANSCSAGSVINENLGGALSRGFGAGPRVLLFSGGVFLRRGVQYFKVQIRHTARRAPHKTRFSGTLVLNAEKGILSFPRSPFWQFSLWHLRAARRFSGKDFFFFFNKAPHVHGAMNF